MRKLIAVCAVLGLSLVGTVNAQQGTVPSPTVIYGSSTTMTCLNSGGCPLMDVQDLVLQLRSGRLVLMRGVQNCTSVQAMLSASPDTAKAECFK